MFHKNSLRDVALTMGLVFECRLTGCRRTEHALVCPLLLGFTVTSGQWLYDLKVISFLWAFYIFSLYEHHISARGHRYQCCITAVLSVYKSLFSTFDEGGETGTMPSDKHQ